MKNKFNEDGERLYAWVTCDDLVEEEPGEEPTRETGWEVFSRGHWSGDSSNPKRRCGGPIVKVWKPGQDIYEYRGGNRPEKMARCRRWVNTKVEWITSAERRRKLDDGMLPGPPR